MSRPIVKSIVSRTRDQGSTDPRVAELPVEKIAAAFKAAVAVAPPLSPEQLARRAADLLMEREPRSNEPGNETPVPTVRVSMFAGVCLRDVRGRGLRSVASEDSSRTGGQVVADEVTFTGQSGTTWRYWGNKPLGTPGGFGGVYAAEGPGGTPMAVKVVKKQLPSGALDERLLRREIDVGRRVADSGSEMLLPIIDAADAGEALLLVMPLADGVLATASIPIGEAEVVPVLVDIATGLQDLHSIGIIHRDLKPANVLRHAGRWKLADFGIAGIRKSGPRTRPSWGGDRFPTWHPNCGS